MKKAFLFCFLFSSLFVFSQKEGQNFCNGNVDGSYFPLDISKKKIYWYNTFYYETLKGEKLINGQTYLEFEQEWKNGEIYVLFLRNDNGQVLEYEDCCNYESLRYSENMPLGTEWKRDADEVKYNIETTNGKLKTPFCLYDNLLVMKAVYEKVTYEFYYLKGLGYVGATQNGKLVSYITPKM